MSGDLLGSRDGRWTRRLRKRLLKTTRDGNRSKGGIAVLRRAQERATSLDQGLDAFYKTKTKKVRSLVKKRKRSYLPRTYPDGFGKLGPKTMQSYLFEPITEDENDVEDEDVSVPQPPKKKRPRAAAAAPTRDSIWTHAVGALDTGRVRVAAGDQPSRCSPSPPMTTGQMAICDHNRRQMTQWSYPAAAWRMA